VQHEVDEDLSLNVQVSTFVEFQVKFLCY
jgi:hypothetical protein